MENYIYIYSSGDSILAFVWERSPVKEVDEMASKLFDLPIDKLHSCGKLDPDEAGTYIKLSKTLKMGEVKWI
jgi:hypothetical protein